MSRFNSFMLSAVSSVQKKNSNRNVYSSDLVHQDMKNLESIKLPPKLTILSRGLFYGCTMLSEIQWPKSLKEIDQAAFCKCYSLYTLELPEGLEYIGWYAFADSGITELKIIRAERGKAKTSFRRTM